MVATATSGEDKMAEEMGFRAALGVPFQEAIKKVTAALRSEGFGVLTQIDMRTTFKDKLNADFRRFVILGACSPPLAYRALAANADTGLLLPCNVTVQEDGDHELHGGVFGGAVARGLRAGVQRPGGGR